MNDKIYSNLDYIAIGERIKMIRGVMQQSEFANIFGLKQQDISKMEKAKLKPSLDVIRNICLKFEKPIEWLLTGQGEMMMNYKPAEEKNNQIITDTQEQYSCHNDNLMEKTAEILQTNSVFKKALDSNIVAFHEAIKLRTDLSVTQTKLKKCQSDLIETQSELHDCKSEIAELRQELNNLKNSLVLKETA